MKFLGSENKQTLKLYNDAFKKEYIKSISLFFSKKLFEDYFIWRSTVTFQNGNTSGQQEFENRDFEVIVLEIRTFIESLDK
jgi:hypothetical protein